MTTLKSLDEMAGVDLMDELSRRRTDHARGRCDYCHQPRATNPCKFPGRHLGREHAGPEVVVLCGSTRFIDTFVATNRDLTLHGFIVLSVGCVTSTDDAGLGINEDAKRRLDDLHKRKIDLADRVLVLNVGGYIGESTISEIAYAMAHGKPVEYLEPEPTIAKAFSNVEPERAAAMDAWQKRYPYNRGFDVR